MYHQTNHAPRTGWAMIVALGILFVIGVATIFVTDTHYARGHDGPINATKQCVFALVSAVAVLVILRVGYIRIVRFAYAAFAVALLALIPLLIARLTHTTFGGLVPQRNGAYRWINVPLFQWQPSEFMKIAFVVALAWYLRHSRNHRSFKGLLIPFALSALPLSLILLEPDLGTVLLLLPVMFTMLYLAGARLPHLAVLVLLGLAAVPPAWGRIKGYQRARVTAVLLQSDALRRAVIENPHRFRTIATSRQALEWEAASGYQLVHAKNALGSGGLSGMGWGRGTYMESRLLPDSHNDFIFAIIGHQWGLIGCLIVLGCYFVLVIAGARVSLSSVEPVGRLVAAGVTTMIAVQALINIAMTIGLMPITGMTLPFVSYGGSSLLTNAIAMALLVSVSRYRPFMLSGKPFEFQTNIIQRPPLAESVDTTGAVGNADIGTKSSTAGGAAVGSATAEAGKQAEHEEEARVRGEKPVSSPADG